MVVGVLMFFCVFKRGPIALLVCVYVALYVCALPLGTIGWSGYNFSCSYTVHVLIFQCIYLDLSDLK